MIVLHAIGALLLLVIAVKHAVAFDDIQGQGRRGAAVLRVLAFTAAVATGSAAVTNLTSGAEPVDLQWWIVAVLATGAACDFYAPVTPRTEATTGTSTETSTGPSPVMDSGA